MTEEAKERAVVGVLEPLSEATATILKPLRLRDTDHLFVWLDTHGSKFVMDLRCLERDATAECGYRESTWPGVSYQAMDLFQRIPERRPVAPHDYVRRNEFLCAGTDYTALIVHHAWPAKDRIHFRPPGIDEDGSWTFPEKDEAKELYEYLLLRFFGQTKRAEKIARFKEEGTEPDPPDQWVENDERPLMPHQRVAAECAVGYDSLFITADRGTGKTPTAIQIVSHRARLKRRAKKGMLRALVVCPPQVRYNWKVEFGRFASVPGKVTIIKGGQVERIRRLAVGVVRSEDDCAFSVGVIGYDSVPNTIEHLMKIPWDIVIADESHKFKSRSTNRWKEGMVQLRDGAACRIPMTGTPIGNTPFDLWTQLEFCGEGLSGFQSYEAFRKFFGKWKDAGGNARGVQKLIAMQNVPLLQERLVRLSFQMTKDEAGLNLPEKAYEFVEVEMTAQQRDVYQQVANRLEIEIQDKLSGETNSLSIQNILTQLLRLAQVTSGHLAYDPIVDERTGDVIRERRVESICDPNPKFEAVVDMLTDDDRDPKGKTIIWCHFVEDIRGLSMRLKRAGIEHVTYYGSTPSNQRDAIVQRFNEDPNCRVIVCNPQTAGEGLNLLGYDWWENSPKLDTYTDHEIFFSCSWSALDRGQAEDRAHRRGTRSQVRITDLIVPGTIDEEIRQRVRGKQEMARIVLDVRDILRAVLGMNGDEQEEVA